MRTTTNRKTRIALFAGVLFCLILTISAFSATNFAFASGAESANYLSKISVVMDGRQDIRVTDTNNLRTAIDSLSAQTRASEGADGIENEEHIEAIIGFDFDFKDTAEYQSFLRERDDLVSQADVNRFRARLADSSYIYHRNMLTERLNRLQFSVEAVMIDYSPFVRIYSENSEILFNDIISFAQSQEVKRVDVQKSDNKQSESTPPSGTRQWLNQNRRLGETGGTSIVGNGTFTGNGVIVGIDEVSYARDLFDNMTIKGTPATTMTSNAEHAEQVTAIIRGIAPDTELFMSNDNDLSWHVSNGVSVVNMSWGAGTSYGTYDTYMDYQAQTHFISLVKSAGNRGSSDSLITSPGYGRNVITVTGTETIRNASSGQEWIRHASAGASYLAPSGYNVPKPTLAAPYYVNVTSPNAAGTAWTARDTQGTSFSAPQVTGAIALLFEKFPALSTRPEEVLARLEASANHEDVYDYDNTTGLANRDAKMGAGILNIDRLLNGTLSDKFFVNNNNRQGQNITERGVSLTSGQIFKANLYWLGLYSNTVSTANSYVTNYDLRLLNSSGTIVAQSNSTVSYSESITYEVPTTGTYRLIVHQTGAYNTHNSDIIGLAWRSSVSSIGVNFSTVTNSTGLTITGFSSTTNLPDTIVIPIRINGTAVTQIGNGSTSILAGTNVKQVVFDDGSLVTTINSNAFNGASQLSQITIPASVNSIGDSAFANCTALSQISIPASVTTIAENAFNSNTIVVLGSDRTQIGSGISFRQDVTVVWEGKYSFRGNEFLKYLGSGTSFSIPQAIAGKTITTIGAYAFEGILLESVVIPNSITNIGDNAFRNCTGLNGIIIPASVVSIGDYAFNGVTSLTSLTFQSSSSLYSIGKRAFECTPIVNVTLPNSLSSIGDGAFAECHSAFENLNTRGTEY